MEEEDVVYYDYDSFPSRNSTLPLRREKENLCLSDSNEEETEEVIRSSSSSAILPVKKHKQTEEEENLNFAEIFAAPSVESAPIKQNNKPNFHQIRHDALALLTTTIESEQEEGNKSKPPNAFVHEKATERPNRWAAVRKKQKPISCAHEHKKPKLSRKSFPTTLPSQTSKPTINLMEVLRKTTQQHKPNSSPTKMRYLTPHNPDEIVNESLACFTSPPPPPREQKKSTKIEGSFLKKIHGDLGDKLRDIAKRISREKTLFRTQKLSTLRNNMVNQSMDSNPHLVVQFDHQLFFRADNTNKMLTRYSANIVHVSDNSMLTKEVAQLLNQAKERVIQIELILTFEIAQQIHNQLQKNGQSIKRQLRIYRPFQIIPANQYTNRLLLLGVQFFDFI